MTMTNFFRTILLLSATSLFASSLSYAQMEEPATAVSGSPAGDIKTLNPAPSNSNSLAGDDTAKLSATARAKADLPQDTDDNKLSLTIGARFLYLRLLSATKGEPHKDSFIGSIYKLSAHQRVWLLRPYAQVMVNPYWGIGISWDFLEVATMDYGAGDGDVQSSALIIYLTVVLPTSAKIKPYSDVGWGFYSNNFDARPEWSRGGLRQFKLENSFAPFLALGCRVPLSTNWEFDIYGRYTNLNVDGIYIFRGDDRPPEPFRFTLDNFSFGLGLLYKF